MFSEERIVAPSEVQAVERVRRALAEQGITEEMDAAYAAIVARTLESAAGEGDRHSIAHAS